MPGSREPLDAGQLGIGEKLPYRWQQAQAITEAGSVEQAQDPACRALRAETQRLSASWLF